MRQDAEIIRVMILTQGLLAALLVVLARALYARFRRAEFFRLWSWAWAFYALALLSGLYSLELGPGPGPANYVIGVLSIVFGFMQIPFLVLGAWCFHSGRQVKRTERWVWMGVAAVAGMALVFAAPTIFRQIADWMGLPPAPATGDWLERGIRGFAVSDMLRRVLLGLAFLASAVLFWRSRKRVNDAAAVTALACALYGLFCIYYPLGLVHFLARPGAGLLSPFHVLDVACQMLLALGIVLLLLEEYGRSMEARYESEARFGGVAESLAEGLLITDHADVVLFANSRMTALTGYSVLELLGKPAYMLLAPEKLWPEIWQRNEERKQGGFHRYEFQMKRKDGSAFWAEVSSAAYRTINADVVGSISTITDISERRRIAGALAASEEKFAKAFRASPDAISISTLQEGRYVEVNDGFVRLSGHAREAAVGRTAAELGIWGNPADREMLMDRLAGAQGVRDVELAFRRRSGELIWGSMSAEVIEVGGERFLLSLVRDVTESRRAASLQHALYRIAEAADKAPTLEALFPQVHNIIRGVMPADNFYIALYDDTTDTLSFPYFVDEQDEASPPGPPGRGNTAYVLRTRKSLLSTVAVHNQMVRRGEVELVGVMSRVWLGVPLKIGDRCLGVMAVQHYTDESAYGEREQRMLEYVSSQVATAIHRRRVLDARTRLVAILESTTDFVSTADAQGRVLFVNSAGRAMLGLSEEAARMQGIADYHPPWAAQLIEHTGIPAAIRDGVWSGETAFRTRDGREIPVSQVMVAHRNTAGEVEFLSTIARDLSERKKMEEALRESQRILSTLMSNLPGMAYRCSNDARWSMIFVSEGVQELLGYTPGDLTGGKITFNSIIHPADRGKNWEIIQEALRQRDPFEMEYRVHTASGEEKWVWERGRGVHAAEGEVLYLEGFITDITSRHRFEEALRTSEEKFSRAFHASPDAMTISNLHPGRFLDVNEGFLRLSGFTREEVVGKTGTELNLWTSLANRDRVIAMLRGGEPVRNLEFNFRSRDGRIIVGLLSAEVIAFGGEPCMLVVVRDITERKQMEEALRSSEERFRELFENANDIVYTHDMEGRYTSLNRAGEIITGYTRAEVLGTNISEMLSPDQHEFTRKMIGAKLRGEGPTTYEIEIRAKDGRPLLLDVSTRLILKDGQPVGVQGIARDVTERRRADRRLRESEERYRRLFDTSPLPIWVFDVNTLAFLAVNDAALSVYGYSKEEFMKLTLPELRLPEDRPALLEAVKEDASKEFFTRYSRHQRKNGTLMDMEIRAHQIEFAGQQARMVIAMDITERLRAEQAIRESEAKFRALTESSPYAILIARGNRVIFANRAAEDIIGYSATELTGRDPLSIIHPDHRDLAREKLAARAAGRMETMRYELKFLSRSGAERWLDMTTDVVVFEGAPAVLMNAVDVTERKIVEDQLRQAQKMEAVGRLAGGVAHDFNNLLMIIRGYADLIVDSGDLGEGAQRNAEQIIKAADRASGLTQQLLAFSRKQVLALQTLDLNLVLQGVDKMLHRLIGEDVELLIQSTPGLWPTKADPNQIEQVLLNLAINARDAMPRGGQLRIETRNVVLDEAFVRQHAGSSAGDFVQLEVSDTGVGMSPEVRARIFEPFFTTKEVGRGTGLGLATVYGIVKQSNGYITVESEADKGTTFRILLPRAAEVMARADQREVSGNLSGNETILLVEDQPDVRELARTFLGGRGYHVLEAQDGSEALRISGGHHGEIHLLVTDVVMPGMSGKELAEQMAPLRPSMKVLFVSGYTAEAIGQHGVLEPGTEFLQKPFSQEALARKLREILDATG